MKNLNDSISEFLKALQQQQSIKLNKNGNWLVESSLKCWFRRIFLKKDSALISLALSFIYRLDQLETIAIRFPVKEETSISQQIDFQKYLLAAKSIELKLGFLKIPEILTLLKQRRIALFYRLKDNTHKPDIDWVLFDRLCQEASYWKQNQRLFWRRELSKRDRVKLEETCYYPEFIHLLWENSDLKNAFFVWILRDGMSVAPFVEFPAAQNRIQEAQLNGRIGRMGNDSLKVIIDKEEEQSQVDFNTKMLVLPFEGKTINILDEKKSVVFQGNYRLTIKEVFETFKNKAIQVGNLEFFAQGVTNWNGHRLGWWNAEIKTYEVIDLDQTDWWFQLPILELFTVEEAQKRYGKNANGTQWIAVAKATREYLNLNFDKSHAYLEVAIPLGGRCYASYDFGKIAIHFPASEWEKMQTFSVTVLATIAYPDENIYYSQRQHVGYCFALSPEHGIQLMQKIKEDMLRSREGNVVFQIESENCGRWIQKLLEELIGKENVPNLYKRPLIDAEPIGKIGKIFRFVRKFPTFCRDRILAYLHYPFGPWKGRWIVDKRGHREWKSLTSSSYWQDGIVYLPAHLHWQRELGSLSQDPNSSSSSNSHFGQETAFEEID
jgi:hypothetical protein